MQLHPENGLAVKPAFVCVVECVFYGEDVAKAAKSSRKKQNIVLEQAIASDAARPPRRRSLTPEPRITGAIVPRKTSFPLYQFALGRDSATLRHLEHILGKLFLFGLRF